MKTLQIGITLCFLFISAMTAKAQIPTMQRQPLFKNAAEKLPAAITELDKAFTAKEGTEVAFKFHNFSFSGTVQSSIKRYENLYSVIIKSTSPDNTLLSISKRINEDKSVTYIGRIINEKSVDGYELIKNTDGTYAFHKIKTEDLIQDF